MYSGEWNDVSLYRDGTDPISYGLTNGRLRRNVTGGQYNNDLKCGSRSLLCYDYSNTRVYASRGCKYIFISWGDMERK